jgi:hypothetical protein
MSRTGRDFGVIGSQAWFLLSDQLVIASASSDPGRRVVITRATRSCFRSRRPIIMIPVRGATGKVALRRIN